MTESSHGICAPLEVKCIISSKNLSTERRYPKYFSSK